MVLVPFLFQAYVIFLIAKAVSERKKAAEDKNPASKNIYNNNHKKEKTPTLGEFIVSISDAIKESSPNYYNHKESKPSQTHKTPSQNKEMFSGYSYKERPDEDYCGGSEMSYDLTKNEDSKASNDDASALTLEERLARLEKEIDRSGNYNISSQDEARKAVVYKEILNKKYWYQHIDTI